MEFDELLKILGEFGRYQKLLLFVMLLACMPTAFNNMSIVFSGRCSQALVLCPGSGTFQSHFGDDKECQVRKENGINYGILLLILT